MLTRIYTVVFVTEDKVGDEQMRDLFEDMFNADGILEGADAAMLWGHKLRSLTLDPKVPDIVTYDRAQHLTEAQEDRLMMECDYWHEHAAEKLAEGLK
jgi:hypothetical protein